MTLILTILSLAIVIVNCIYIVVKFATNSSGETLKYFDGSKVWLCVKKKERERNLHLSDVYVFALVRLHQQFLSLSLCPET